MSGLEGQLPSVEPAWREHTMYSILAHLHRLRRHMYIRSAFILEEPTCRRQTPTFPILLSAAKPSPLIAIAEILCFHLTGLVSYNMRVYMRLRLPCRLIASDVGKSSFSRGARAPGCPTRYLETSALVTRLSSFFHQTVCSTFHI